MPKPVLYIAIGLPASGKSTWFSKKNGIAVVCADQIRAEVFGSEDIQASDEFLRENGFPADSMTDREKQFQCNKLIWREADRRVMEYLKEGRDVAYDGTNIRRKYRQPTIERFSPFFTIHGLYFDTPLETCIERDRTRESHTVGEEKIRIMHKVFDPPVMEEGYDLLETLDAFGQQTAIVRRKDSE